MDLVAVVASSALVSSIVGSVAGFITQRKLAERQAQLEYELNARRRLYEAIGPLHFQLLIAARDVVRRVGGHHTDRWDMSVGGYYVRSFVYRLLRPLSILELVERQMSYADFSVDPAGFQLIQFEAAAHRMLVDADPFPYHSGIDWTAQTQHVFRDNLRLAAHRSIEPDASGKERVITYGRFSELYPDPGSDQMLSPLVSLFGRCKSNLTELPLWWVRVVGYAYVNRWFPTQGSNRLGKVTDRPLDVRRAIAATKEPEIMPHVDEYPQIFDQIVAEGI